MGRGDKKQQLTAFGKTEIIKSCMKKCLSSVGLGDIRCDIKLNVNNTNIYKCVMPLATFQILIQYLFNIVVMLRVGHLILTYLTFSKKSWPSALKFCNGGNVDYNFFPPVGKGFVHLHFYDLIVVPLLDLRQ